MDVYGESNKGLARERNEDRFLVRSLENGNFLLAVADGMGGEAAGDIAAQILVDALGRVPTSQLMGELALSKAFGEANAEVLRTVNSDPALYGMGTTATAVIINEDKFVFSHIGDSRLYLLRSGLIKKITDDHTLVQRLIDGGVVSIFESLKHPLRHILEQCIGCDDPSLDSGTISLEPKDVLLLCTDGLTKEVDEIQIADVLNSHDPATTMAHTLVELALSSGGRDNVTVVVARL